MRRLHVVHHCERSCQARAGVEPPVVSLNGTHDECSTRARKCITHTQLFSDRYIINHLRGKRLGLQLREADGACRSGHCWQTTRSNVTCGHTACLQPVCQDGGASH